MSLAGLDAPAVVEAYQASIADTTGWFFLKYQDGSRETVEVFKQGVGGGNEARKAVEGYTEKSPLYGLAQYRRRKVILKYVPDGTSRVLQVRLKVQFQSILDSFTHDTVFTFSEASELTESALALATMLLPSNGSVTSSSSSLRKRRLNDISEDGDTGDRMKNAIREEPPSHATSPTIKSPMQQEQREEDKSSSEVTVDRLPASALRAKALLAKRKELEIIVPSISLNPPEARPAPTVSPSTAPPRDTSLSAASLQQPTPTFGLEKSLPAIPIDSPPSTTAGFEKITEEYLTRDTTEGTHPQPESSPRLSLTAELLQQSHTPSGADSSSITLWNDEVAAYTSVKPKKKKLAPRPHVDNTTRPRTSGAAETATKSRPVANLPTSVRIANTRPPNASRQSYEARPTSRQSSKSVPGRFPPTTSHSGNHPPLPNVGLLPPPYRPESRVFTSRAGSVTAEPNANATPEKLRLMKALQMRKRNMLLAQRQSVSTQASASSVAQSESLASTNTSRGVYPLSTIAKLEETSLLTGPSPSTKQASSTTSPTTTTNDSASQSPLGPSYTSQNETDHRRYSLSSDTSSSITPKAEATDQQDKRKTARRRSPKVIAALQPTTQVTQTTSAPKPERAQTGVGVENEQQSATETRLAPSASLSESNKENEHRDALARAEPQTPKGLQKEKLKPAPLQIVSSAEHSEVSDNDSLMDELQHATVHEAKPVSVARTPVTPIVSRGSRELLKETNRSISTPLPRASEASKSSTSLEKPKSSGGRSTSTALPQWPPQSSEPVPLTKKSTLGSGISKRIKALEVVSSRQSTSPPRQPVAAQASSVTRSAFSTFTKRASLIMHQQAPNTSTENSPPKKVPEPLMTERARPAEIPRAFEQQQLGGVLAPPPKGETISVTARIIRDDPEMYVSESADTNEYMYRSPLIVEHERPKRDIATSGTDTIVKSPKGERGRFSFSAQRSHSHPKLPSESLVSKLPFGGSRNKLTKSVSDGSSVAEERPKSSRAGRLMKRVSNLTGGRKSQKDLTAPAAVEHPEAIEEDERESRASMAESLLHVVDIGDVNVQFPDSLLWKRRFIRVDDQGYLIFSPPANEANAKAVSRKYHLGDFKTPTLPDVEREEMANSIILDMKDGNTLQCACESKSAQRKVLQLLVDAHSAYHQLFGNAGG